MAWPDYEDPLMPQPQRPLTEKRPKLRHTWAEGDDILSVALKYDADPEEILDLNLVEEHEIKVGQELAIPKRRKKAKERNGEIRYEALENPVLMHVNKPEGIKKYSFGHAQTTDEIHGKGHFKLGTKITVVGIAHVPIGDETLAYYMDTHAFGKYAETGRVNWNIGYAWSELTEGEYVPQEEPEAPAPTILEEPDEPFTMFDEETDPEPEPEPEKPKDGVLMPLNADWQPEKFLFEKGIEIHELHERHAPIQPRKNDPIWIIGTFHHEGEPYYQPGKNVGEVMASGLLWPIPMDALVPEDEVHDYSIKRRGMTRQEKWWELLSKASANYTKLMVTYKQKRTEKN